MQRNIQQITQQLVDQLPANNQYYRPEELRSWGFPSFLVERIIIELERNLDETLVIPKTDWANTQTEAVQSAWQKFADTIQSKVRLPASYGKAVIETAVSDILEMLVQPRKNIPKVVFGQDDQLSYEQVTERVKAVVVYPHFSRLIPRYMQKKELETLTKSRCRKVISTADEKLISRYSPLNWAQMLEPIFKLVGGEIDSNLLRLFFEDKNMPRVARKFDLMSGKLTRAELIEVLSSPEMLNFEGYKDDQSTLFEDQSAASPSPSAQKSSGTETKSSYDRSPDEQEKEQQDFRDKAIEEPEKTESPADKVDQKSEGKSKEESENTLNSGFIGEDEPTTEVEENAEDENSLNSLFNEQKEGEGENGESAPGNAGVTQEDEINDREKPNQPEKRAAADEINSETAPDESVRKESKEEIQQENRTEKSSDDEDEKPIWMRFMSDEEIEEYNRRKQQEDQADEVEEGFIDDPIVDLTDEEASDEEINNLRNRLSGNRDFFVEEIFGGSERAFDEAVENIAPYNNWREASKFIEKEIFKRNHVDVYSEAAVSFTDQLQNYFFAK